MVQCQFKFPSQYQMTDTLQASVKKLSDPETFLQGTGTDNHPLRTQIVTQVTNVKEMVEVSLQILERLGTVTRRVKELTLTTENKDKVALYLKTMNNEIETIVNTLESVGRQHS